LPSRGLRGEEASPFRTSGRAWIRSNTYFNITPNDAYSLYQAAELIVKERFEERLVQIRAIAGEGSAPVSASQHLQATAVSWLTTRRRRCVIGRIDRAAAEIGRFWETSMISLRWAAACMLTFALIGDVRTPRRTGDCHRQRPADPEKTAAAKAKYAAMGDRFVGEVDAVNDQDAAVSGIDPKVLTIGDVVTFTTWTPTR